MRKITILEVLDPVKNEFIPIKQAINQGLFNTKTYLFFDPIRNQHYSITQAAKLGLFKSAIDLRPEALIVERIKVAQTVSLLSARDPHNQNKLLPIHDAIELGVVDTNLRIYRDTVSNKVVDFNDAVDSDLIQVQILREITEKVTETLTEQKNPDNPENLGILKKIETHTYGSSSDVSEPLELTKINGVYVFDRTKSLSINKMMKKYDDDIAAGFITDSNSYKILKNESNSPNPVIDFNDALSKNLIILPDSLCLTQNVQYVIDLNTGNKFDFEAACEIGLINIKTKTFYDTKKGQSISLFEALEKNYIVMKNELYNNYDQDEIESESSDTNYRISYLDLESMFDPLTGLQISVKKALEIGILSRDKRFYVDLHTGKKLSLNDSVEKGLAVLKPEKIQHKINEGYQFLHISGVHNPMTKKEMSLTEAINLGFLDYSECEFHDPLTGKTMTLLDAYDKGYLITKVTMENSENDEKEDMIKSKKDAPPKSRIVRETNETSVIRSSRRTSEYQNPDSLNDQQKIPTTNKIQKSQSVSPQRNLNNSKFRSASAYDMKSLDRLSTTSRKSVITKIKEKLIGKKSKYNRFDDYLIKESMKINDTKSKIYYKLEEAIQKNLLKPHDRIIDSSTGIDYSINDAIKNGLIKFYHPLNNFEFKYDQSCSIFNNEYLLLVNYVIEPSTRRKVGLKNAFSNMIIDKENCIYFKKKPIPLIQAIEKGHLSCEIIDLNQLNSVITSNIFKLYKPVEDKVEEKIEEKDELTQKVNSKLKASPIPPPIVKRSFPSQDDFITDNEDVFRSNENLTEKTKIIPKHILEKSGLKFNPRKDYCIFEVFDADQNKFVSLNKAIFLQIFDLNTQEYIDSKTGDSISLLIALKKNKIKIKETSNGSRFLATSSDYDEIYEESKQTFNSAGKNSSAYESLLDEPIDITELPINETISYDSISNSTFARQKSDYEYDIVKVLLYKKATNGKYIRFDRVVRNKLFDAENCRIKDLKNDEYFELYDALRRGLLRINDVNVLFDDSRIYVVESITLRNQKMTLPEAVEKKTIDKSKGVIKHSNYIYTYYEAFKQGYIEARVLTFSEIKWILEDFAKRIKEKIELKQTVTRKIIEPEIYSPVSKTKIKPDFYIFDGSSDSYLSINDAFYHGILLNDPIRIKDPSNNNYILLKDAVIKGLVSCEPKSGARKSSFLTHNRKSYIIDSIYDPRRKHKYSLAEATKTGVFNNGIYKNFLEGKSYQIDEAIQKGYILGRIIDFDLIELSLKYSLSDSYKISSSTPPVKPSRGVFVEEEDIVEEEVVKRDRSRTKSKSPNSEKRKKFVSQEIIKSKIEPFSGRVVSIQDIVSGKYLKVDDAEKFGLINFRDGTFKNSLTDEVLKINDAMERGFILVESNLKKIETRKRTQSMKSRQTLNSGRESADFLETSRIEIGQQFDIISVLDPIKRKHVTLDEAINEKLFEVNSAMYIDSRTKKRFTLVDAIDLGYVKIADKNFRPSYKLVIEENDRNFVKNIKSLSLRYVVDSFSKQIIPFNVAVSKKLVNSENGTYIGYEKIISLKEAYDKFLVFTTDDLDELSSKRGKFRIACVRKSTTGKNMSLKSALAKNWININRRVYIDKQTNQEIPFSQAVDMDLLVLKSSLEFKDDVVSANTSVISRSKSKDNYLNDNTRRKY